MIGFICINKKVGDSSSYCVNKVKKTLKEKCGHMGTLDPLASGVLPVGIGQATRLFDILLNKQKVYIATFDFSYTTPSLDLETQPSFYSNKVPTKDEIEAIIPNLVGEIDQIPPSYSAKFVDGKRSYKLARQGVEVALPPKKIVIYSIKLLDQISSTSYRFEITCGGGTYIRSIVRDMANLLNCYGVMTKLERVKSGAFTIENSVTIDELLTCKNPEKYLIKPQDVLDYDDLILDETTARKLLDGLTVNLEKLDGLYKVYNGETFWGVGEINQGILKMKVYVRDL